MWALKQLRMDCPTLGYQGTRLLRNMAESSQTCTAPARAEVSPAQRSPPCRRLNGCIRYRATRESRRTGSSVTCNRAARGDAPRRGRQSLPSKKTVPVQDEPSRQAEEKEVLVHHAESQPMTRPAIQGRPATSRIACQAGKKYDHRTNQRKPSRERCSTPPH